MRITKNRVIKLAYILALPFAITCIVIVATFVARKNNLLQYNAGVEYYNNADYQNAKAQFKKVNQFKSSSTYLNVIGDIEHIQSAATYNGNEEYEDAYLEIKEIDITELKSNSEKIGDEDVVNDYFEVSYDTAIGLFNDGKTR